MICRTIPLVLMALGAAALPAFAQQEPTVEELTRLFERQKQAFQEAGSNGLGQTRGLRLVTVDDVAAEPVGAAPQVATDAPLAAPPPDAQGGVSVIAGAESSPQRPSDPNRPLVPVSADAPVVFGQLDPELQVNLRIEFGFDSAAISDDQKPKLEKMCLALRGAGVSTVRIVGHTDSAGTDAYNQTLSELRAREVARQLVDGCGIEAARIETLGMGERFPFNPSDTRADENRRVEFQALS